MSNHLLTLQCLTEWRNGYRHCYGRGGSGVRFPAPIESDTDANGSLPLQCFCVAQALRRGDGPHHSLHTSAQYLEHNDDSIFFFYNFVNAVLQNPCTSDNTLKLSIMPIMLLKIKSCFRKRKFLFCNKTAIAELKREMVQNGPTTIIKRKTQQ